MTDCSDFSEISVLIPGYSIEDLPTDLEESDAASLLNAIACAWHPSLLARCSGVPLLRQAESLTGYPGRRVILVPKPSEAWMPHEWRTTLRNQGHIVIEGCSDRSEWITAIESLSIFDSPDTAPQSPAEIDGFLALGTVLLQTTLLSRRRHHFVDADAILLGREVRGAAKASLDGDTGLSQQHLKRCFEHVRDVREKFFPLNCYLLDICIPGETASTEDLRPLLESTQPLSLFATGRDLVNWNAADPEFTRDLFTAVAADRIAVLSGDHVETRLSLGSMAFALADLRRGLNSIISIIGRTSVQHARRRFGLTASLPTLLKHHGIESALHVALDDGLYPDRERSQFDWQAPDGSVVAASSRIPLAIDGAAAFLKFADRLNESMSDDTTAAMFFARLPQLKSPWLKDLQVAAGYAPVLGQFATFSQLISATEGTRSRERHSHPEYLSPFLIQTTVLKSEAPVSGPATIRLMQHWCSSLRCLTGIAAIARALPDSNDVQRNIEQDMADICDLEFLHADTSASSSGKAADEQRLSSSIREHLQASSQTLLTSLLCRTPQQRSDVNGLLLVNPMPFGRTVELEWPSALRAPAQSSAIEASERTSAKHRLLVKLPPGGFAWLTEADHATTQAASTPRRPQPNTVADRHEPPLADKLTLRNRHFEVTLSDRTGGIASIAWHGRRGNRMSQQVGFRYEREVTLPAVDSDAVSRKAAYADCILIDHAVLENGPVFASIATTSELRSPVDGSLLAVVRQVTSLNRVQPRVHVTLSFEQINTKPKGNPWLCYYGCRFAWDNEVAAVTRSVMGHAAGFRSERFESPDYIEVTDGDQRLCIVPHGRPYHRRSGPRMLDSLLIVEGEPETTFRFTLELDQPFPLRASTDIITPPFVLPTAGAVPTVDTGWILGLSARNVELVDIITGDIDADRPSAVELRIIVTETEGSSVQCQLRTARTPVAAFLIDGTQAHKSVLDVSDQGVRIPIGPFQLREVLLQFQ